MTLVKYKWGDLGGYVVHLFVIHDNVLTAFVSVINQAEYQGPWTDGGLMGVLMMSYHCAKLESTVCCLVIILFQVMRWPIV